jgi:hypothetical protein
MFLVQREFDFTFIALDVVVCDPETRYTGPERAGKVVKWVEEAVVNYLVDEWKYDRGEDENENVKWREQGEKIGS